MEHITTLFRNRLSLSKIFRFPAIKQSFTSIDSVFTISMIVFGIIGCVSVLYLQADPSAVTDNSQILTGSSPGAKGVIKNAAFFASNDFDKKSERYVHIAGSKKAGYPISFVIDTFEKDASYTFDFGNGIKQIAKGKETRYTYNQSGMYQVKLEVAFQGETSVLSLDHLWVE